ncbi:hypothetical protein D4764_22G0002270, partial [Takifugu flavidus]
AAHRLPSTSPTFLSIPGGSFCGSAGSPELLVAPLQRAARGDLQMRTVSAPGNGAAMLTLATTALAFSFMKTGMIVSVVRKVLTHPLPSWMEGYQATTDGKSRSQKKEQKLHWTADDSVEFPNSLPGQTRTPEKFGHIPETSDFF